jgi:flagellar basal-body rod modification protein FlgD
MPSNAIGALGVTTPTGPTATTQSGFMGKDDFLKVLVAQMKYQDPTSPTDIEGMTQQMTQFSILEQLTNMNKSSERDNAVSMLGKTVTYLDGTGAPITGLVEHVDVGGATPKLTVAGRAGVDPAQIQSVS